jgi:three-Cys-motif partner protein
MDAYVDREQTLAKHFILRRYLQALVFKVLRHWDVAYVDGFSGPWESKTADFSDTSFMIAIEVLQEAQRIVQEQTGTRRKIKCFFVEKDPKAYQQLIDAVAPHGRPDEQFEVRTFQGEFVEAVGEIQSFVGRSFPLIFIDPTGWTGYPFTKIAPLFRGSKCEALITFMYSHISRFPAHPDPRIIASLDPIFGGPGWQRRLDPSLKRGPAMEKLFRETFKAAGPFDYVVSTRIDKSTQNRPHFFLAYGTKDRAGLIAFRQIEYDALREHARNRSAALTRKREDRSSTTEMFAEFEADQREASIDDLVAEQMQLATDRLLEILRTRGALLFAGVVDLMLQEFMLRETNVKTICVELAREGAIQRTWGPGNRRPEDANLIKLATG